MDHHIQQTAREALTSLQSVIDNVLKIPEELFFIENAERLAEAAADMAEGKLVPEELCDQISQATGQLVASCKEIAPFVHEDMWASFVIFYGYLSLVDSGRLSGPQDAVIRLISTAHQISFAVRDAASRAQDEKHQASMKARNAAGKRHAENRDMKATARQYYADNRASFKNKDEAAQYIADKVVPVKVGTVRSWLQGFNPESD